MKFDNIIMANNTDNTVTTVKKKWRLRVSIPRPYRCKRYALPTAPNPPFVDSVNLDTFAAFSERAMQYQNDGADDWDGDRRWRWSWIDGIIK